MSYRTEMQRQNLYLCLKLLLHMFVLRVVFYETRVKNRNNKFLVDISLNDDGQFCG